MKLRISTVTILYMFLLFLYFFHNSILSCILLNLSSFNYFKIPFWFSYCHSFFSPPSSFLQIILFVTLNSWFLFQSFLCFLWYVFLHLSAYLINPLSIHLPKILSINFLSFFSNCFSLLAFLSFHSSFSFFPLLSEFLLFILLA